MNKLHSLIVILFIAVNIAFSQVNLDSGLVAYYPFNGNADDASGNNNHGTVHGTILIADRHGNDSSAYEFNGTSSYISIPNSASLQSPSNELTQVAWIYIYSWSLVGSPFGPILMKSNSSANGFQYRLNVGSGHINTSINNWNNSVIMLDTINFNEWYMIASTLKNDTVKTYVNGISLGEDTLAGPINPDTRPLEIGRDVPGWTEVFHGIIDDIRVYNRALTEPEIQELAGISVFIDENTTILDHFKLFQNYPNPFNPSTQIKYTLLKSEKVKIEVFNLLGQKIETLFNKQMPAGSHEIEFTARELSSGVYLYRIEAGAYQEVKKMILLK